MTRLQSESWKATRNALLACEPICFNQTKYFVRNGTTIKQCRWGIGNVYFNYETIPEQFSNVLRAFNTKRCSWRFS